MTQSVYTSYPKNPLMRGLTNNSTDADSVSVVPTTTEPVTVDSDTPTSNALVVTSSGSEILLFPFGTDADNEQFQMRIVMWRKIPDASTPLWIPYLAGEFDCTLSATAKGVASAPVVDTEFFADTITETGTTWDDGIVTVVSRADNRPAMIRVKTLGFEKIGVYFDIDILATDAASANVCYAIV